jgi:hypothetical protein
MREAQRRLAANVQHSQGTRDLGGITRIAGMVHDPQGGDLIIVGEAARREHPVALDDLVVALRAVMLHGESPLVSIDKTPETPRTRKQVVRYEGGIENTRFGRDMLEADILLKRLAFGKVAGEIWGIRSYGIMSAERARGGTAGDRIASRFWFAPTEPSLAEREGVFAIMGLQLGVQTEVLYAESEGRPASNAGGARDDIGDAFAAQVERNLGELGAEYSEIARAKPLLALVAVAEGIKRIGVEQEVRFWLRDYAVERIETRRDYDLIEVSQEVEGRELLLTLSGGLQLNPIVLRLEAGDVTALREAVLRSRPSPDALTWQPPLDGWQIPGAEVAGGSRETDALDRNAGFSLERVLTPRSAGASPFTSSSALASLPEFHAPLPTLKIERSLAAQTVGNRVGGVMLSGSAKVPGTNGAKLDLSSGNFSLIVEGARARLAPETFRKFITALWAVYYERQDPGISIDPIAPGVDKHLVRYIGKVINTDLGRVMREADYLMKKWAVGTEHPDVPGFQSVDDLTVRHGLDYVGASRRFWFVPDDMRFRRGGDALLFDSGRMMVNTEYVVQNKGTKAAPADEAFARFFTAHYPDIAAKHPVYNELFEYAKMVSLAKYLKDNGVPLLWFLMANKDQVITEDSPGTVDALAKGSDHFANIKIEGGVDLGSTGNYVFDAQAVSAINEAVSRIQSNTYPHTEVPERGAPPAISPASFSFDLSGKSYTVVPYHSLTSGKDRRGIRYQTDLALREDGQPGLEVVRYFNPTQQGAGEFGQGWHLLVPYRIKPVGEKQREFLNAQIPEKMAVENLLSGEREVLTFSTDRYSIAGYVPDQIASSQVVGLFIISDASFRLADKLGNEFWFDQAGHLTDMIFGKEHHVHFEYLASVPGVPKRYRIEPVPGRPAEFRNLLIPEKMRVIDTVSGSSEVLHFSDKRSLPSYVPEGESRFESLVLVSDTSCVLVDKQGNELVFEGGRPTRVTASGTNPLVSAVALGEKKVTFTYDLDPADSPRVAKATLSGGAAPQVDFAYQYDESGRLARVVAPDQRVVQEESPAPMRVAAVGR